MATKENPGDFDCYAAAAPDEPLFTLLARDPLAPYLVVAWVCLRESNVTEALNCMYKAHAQTDLPDPNPVKLEEAMKCAGQMRAWKLLTDIAENG